MLWCVVNSSEMFVGTHRPLAHGPTYVGPTLLVRNRLKKMVLYPPWQQVGPKNGASHDFSLCERVEINCIVVLGSCTLYIVFRWPCYSKV